METEEFRRIRRLPPYVLGYVNELKHKARQAGDDIIDLGMGNPDMPTPKPIVDKLIEAAVNPRNHRYSASRGVYKLRHAICSWYKRRFDVDLDPDSEAVVTIGSKEGLSHLILTTITHGDVVLVPDPTYPIHQYSVVIAGGDLISVPLLPGNDFFEALVQTIKRSWPHPKMIILSFPHNPTTAIVDITFFEKVVEIAKEHGIIVVHDFAYADSVFDDYRAPSFLQVKGARDVGVELFTLSKSYNMPGWRVGFVVGNAKIVQALTRLKSYMDYGIFQPIQIASIIALNGDPEWVADITRLYGRRRDVLISGMNSAGWPMEKPKATMFVWAQIPERLRSMGSLEFSKQLLQDAKVAVAPGIGFGEHGEGYVRLALVENEHRIKQAIRSVRCFLRSKAL
ncbi:MAG TPA: aminotransferase class I/II-fold pyridoxal phosphate-dependent enzyme [Thermodesulfobacteriota bacterium]|nr:aminotransferase class I/II-fold pyridoxal phosphate-dependent enzyme [Deltaproteobacteria bacterium]HNU71527.1 aminotransferase class I/II-fold pyridoxal phosphate-dependent enzyme [Thermodesulfobacteriota bacterium]